MKLLWNSLLLSLGILLPVSPSIVLAESPQSSESASVTTNTVEFLPVSVESVSYPVRSGVGSDTEAQRQIYTQQGIAATGTTTANLTRVQYSLTSPPTPLLVGYGVYTSCVQPASAATRPPNPPILGGTGISQSPPELGDLGGFSTSNANREDLCIHSSLQGEESKTLSSPTVVGNPAGGLGFPDGLHTSENHYLSQETATVKEPATVVVPTTQDATSGTATDEASPSIETTTTPDAAPITEDGDATENVQTTESNQDSAETETTDSANSEESQAEVPALTPEELARQQKLIEADQLYLSGQTAAAQQLYREAKDPFTVEAPVEEQAAPFYETTQLSPAGAVYWRQSEAGLAQRLETKILAPLQLLVEQYPEFIPGHLRYAQALEEYGREEEALQVLERATTLYPNEPELLKATITALGESQKWLEASLAARQFALLHPDHPQSGEFTALAEENLERYKSRLRRKLRGNAIANAITGTLGFILTGNLFGPISAIDTTVLMLRGESAVGESVANRAKKQLPLLEDEEVLAYVREVGNKLATVAGRNDFEYEFYVVRDDQLNAFALPGGKVFVNAGAILKTHSEAELAGLLAHELSHAVLSHGFQLVTEGNLIANVTSYIPYGGTAANLIVLDYNRDMERQADALGTRILVSSGYAADGMRNLMVTLGKEEEREGPVFAWLSTHPDIDERINNLESLIERNGYNRYAYEGVARHIAIQERVAKLLQEQKDREEEE